MSFSQRFIVALFSAVSGVLFRVHDEQMRRIPAGGPLILYSNHVNIMELPIFYAHIQPRRVCGLVLSDRWKNPIFHWGLDACGMIPLARGEPNLDSMKKALRRLEAGDILVIAPEGTRSHNGNLQRAHPGIVPLALKSNAPLLPLVYHGGEQYRQNLKRLKRTEFYIEVGKPFYLAEPGEPVTRKVRMQMLDEIMYQMAALLPPRYRGDYADLPQATQNYLVFPEEV